MPHILQVDHLIKKYNEFTAVNGISFHMKAGEILGFLGPNGSGKTTTIQMLLGTLSSTSGQIQYFGKDLNLHRSEILSSISYASTYTSLPYNLTIDENLSFFGLLFGIKNLEKSAYPLLERFSLLDKKNKLVSSLSAGQVTRFMLVKAFFTNPKIVLLDEPTASLDPDISSDICEFLLEQREKTGLAILFTSHKMDEVTKLCDRTIFINKGDIIADDFPKNLARKVGSTKIKITTPEPSKKRLEDLASSMLLTYSSTPKSFEVNVEEKDVQRFLNLLTHQKIEYSGIQIQEPSLEAFFLKIAGKIS